jgi:glucokinase
MRYGFGIDLGGTTVKLAFFDVDGNMIHKWEIPTNTAENGSHILPDIAAAVKRYLAENLVPTADVIGIGIGVPGPVSSQGVVNKCVNLGWGVFNIASTLAELTGLPVKAGNDANVAALGEYWKGGGEGCENMIMATLGTGVGGGIVVGGQVLHGAHGSGGEIGHLVLNREETVACGCGKKGCVEQYCSATGIANLARKALATSDAPSALRSLPKIMAKDVFDAAAAGDSIALAAREQYFAYLGEFLANLSCVIDPEVIVLGGGVSKAGQVLIDGLTPYFHKYVFHAASAVRFAIAQLGNDAGAYGAFKLALDAFA